MARYRSRGRMWSWARAAATFALLALAAEGTAADFRLRWQPSVTVGVTGYNVYVRPVDGAWGAPRDAGLPAVAADGSMAWAVTGLQAGVGYRFAVAAVRDGVESAYSNELGVCGADTDCDDGSPCTADVCSAGRCTNPAANEGASCADANPCDGAETCRSGICQAGTPPSCDDGNPCTTDGCSASVGCTHALVSGCQGCTTSGTCSDGNPCNGTESCVGGFCQTGTPLACSDGNSCTVDMCSAQTGCINTPLAGCQPCGTSAECDDGNPCNGAESCSSGRCRAGVAPSCADGDPCTRDACDPASGCTHEVIETCFACDGGTTATLRANRVTIKRSVYGIHYRASGILQTSAPVDPAETGLVFDIRRPDTGQIFYRGIVPASALERGRVGNVIRFDTRQSLASAEGLRFLRIRRMRGGRMAIAVFGRATQMPASFPVSLGWNLMIGDQCASDSCTAYPRRTQCD